MRDVSDARRVVCSQQVTSVTEISDNNLKKIENLLSGVMESCEIWRQ